VRRLNATVRVVKPTEMLMLMNLRLRPAQALTRALADLDARMKGATPARRRVAERAATEMRRLLARGEWSAAFAAGKRADAALADGIRPEGRP